MGRGGLLGAEKFVSELLNCTICKTNPGRGWSSYLLPGDREQDVGEAGGTLGLVDNQGNFLYPVNSNYTSRRECRLIGKWNKAAGRGRVVGYLVHLGEWPLSDQHSWKV